MIHNPIFKGFNPDPCICRKGDDYYVAVSSFEWFPGIPVYHSKDLKNWELYTHVLTDDEKVELRKLPSAKGIWAPCLTYCEPEDLFYVVYGVMNSMNARYFDVDNYVITAKDIRGPWSEPTYLNGRIRSGEKRSYGPREKDLERRYGQRMYRGSSSDQAGEILLHYVRRGRYRL